MERDGIQPDSKHNEDLAELLMTRARGTGARDALDVLAKEEAVTFRRVQA